ncbi:MAG: hypothetical protein ABH843_02065 [Candidatus Omnitrophota bacterium]
MKSIDFKNLDKKSKIELAITSLAVIILIIVSTNGIKSLLRSKKEPTAVIIEPAAIKEMIRQNMGELSVSKQPEEKARAEAEKAIDEGKAWGRDPFVPWGIMAESSDLDILGIKLEGIIWDQANPTAVINGGIYQAGDSIKNINILKIKKQSLTVTDGKKEYNIELR